MDRLPRFRIAALLMLPCAIGAHQEGGSEPSTDLLASSGSQTSLGVTAKPRLLANGQLYVPKAAQRLLGLRTEVAVDSAVMHQSVVGEVVPDPSSAGHVTAEQSGRLEAPEHGWPLIGARISAGDTLAYLRPVMTLREQAQRRAALAQVDEDLQISEINVERLKLQADANGTLERGGNVYYEQARLEWEGLKQKYRLESEALNSRTAVRANVAGILIAANARPGEMVSEAQPLFEVADRAHLRIAVKTFDSTLSTQLKSATLRGREPEDTQALQLRGYEVLDAQQGWRLLFDAQTVPQTLRMPGEIVTVDLELTPRPAVQVSLGCVPGIDGNASAWVHVAPERFERRSVPSCALGSNIATQSVALVPGDRVVVQGAALLSEYR